MSKKPNNTSDTKKNIISNSSSSRNCTSIQMGVLSPKPSCSKDLTNCISKSNLDDGITPYHLKYEEETENSNLLPLPKLPLRSENILNSYSDYEIYDDNNNCMLTNLNDFGLTYFNINDNNETAEEYLDNNAYLDTTPNDIDEIFKRLTDNLDVSKKEAQLERIDSEINDNIDILNLDEIKKQIIIQEDIIINGIDSQQNVSNETREQLDENNHDFFQKYHECYIHNDIEQALIYHIIPKVCDADVNEIPNDSEKIINNNKLPELNVNDGINIVDIEDKDSLLVNDREFDIANNSGNQSDDSDACSYHSSDFEFINEEEARKECKLNMGTIDIVQNVAENNAKYFDHSYIIKDYFSRPKLLINSSIPSGDDYHNLFLRQNVPYACINIEHKATLPIMGMEVSHGPTIDLKCFPEEDAKCKKEADESVKIILSMYPNENSRVSFRRSK